MAVDENGAAAAQKAADDAARARGDILSDAGKEEEAERLAQEAADKAKADAEAAEKAKKDAGDDEEGEETEEEKAEREREERNQRIRIPKKRFDEAVSKARAREEQLQKRIQELEQAQVGKKASADVQALQAKVDDLQDKYEELILDGKKDEARKTRKEIEAARLALDEYRINTSSAAARAQAVEELKYDAELARVEGQFPELNYDNQDVYDEAKADEVLDMMTAFVKNGQSRHEALRKAVKYVMGTPSAKADEGKKADDKRSVDDRAKSAREKAAAANGKQPPNSNKIGLDSDKLGKTKGDGDIDVLKLTKAQFDKLDKETLSRLRGDTI